MGKGVISDEEDEIEAEYDDREPVDGDELNDRGDDDEDEEDEEGQDEYEKDGFIVDDVEEEEDDEDERAESDEERQKKKKKKKKEDYVLDEEDYALLEDNNITVRRKASKKFKRLKKAQRDAAEEPSGLSDEEEFVGRGKGACSAEEKVERSLFDDDDGGPPFEEIAEEEELAEEEEEMGVEDDEDEMDGFIVDEFDDRGEPVKKKSGRKRYISSNSSEAIDMFGEYEQLLKRRKQALRVNENREKTLEDEFDPSILSERYMTRKDEEIWNIDIPERIQTSEEITGPYPHERTEEESTWIYSQLVNGPLFHKGGIDTEKYRDLRDHIARFLELYHVQKCDIPFIAMYRKDECSCLLEDPEVLELDDERKTRDERVPSLKWSKILWAIHELDRKWLLLRKRKSALVLHYRKRFEEETRTNDDVTKQQLNEILFESIRRSLEAAESEREVDDVDSKFNLHFPPGEVDDRQYKRPVRKSRYSICVKAGLWEVANKFGYSSEQLGSQLSLEKMGGEELEDPKLTPEEMASNFTCAMFATPQKVLEEARDMAAIEISCEPGVRKFVRSYYMDHARVSTCPTPMGDTEIDAFHQFAGVKWLQNKPLNEFEDAQWLLIQKAEEAKLLQVNIKIPEGELNKLNNEFNFYLSDGVSRSAQLWNEQRKLILQVALSRILSSMEKEARSMLTSRAKTLLLMEYGKALWNKVSIGPYQKKETDLSSDDEGAPRVMACCWGGKNSQTAFVMLDASGELIDVLYTTSSLTSKSQNVDDQQRSKIEQDRVLKFMTDHQPHVVVLGAADLSCIRLKDNIYEIIFKMVEENPRDLGHEMDMLDIVYGDESLPCLYEHSQISHDQLPGHGSKGIVRRAVALGRYLQNPLAMVATLCGPRREVLSWKLSNLEDFLTPDEKYGLVEQVMIDVTNQVGLDINLALAHEWLFAPLQFISGLGPRKAAFLKKSLLRRGAIFIRKDLVAEHKLGRKVFLNAAGFLRVRRSGLAATSSQFIDLLDDTRIHPECYALAQELAKDVYDVDGTGDVNDNEALEMAIEHVRDRPSYLKSLDIEAYVQTKRCQSKSLTLHDIRRELIQGFQDWRRQYEAPSPDEEFYMLSHETEETLSEGRIVQARVVRVQDRKAILELDSGLTGMLAKEDYTDDWRDITDLSERLSEGEVLTCKIKSIQKNRHHVFLVCKQSEMRNNRIRNARNLDRYYSEDRSSLQSEQDKARKEKELAKRHFKPRMIVHPRFQNATADEAMEFLSDKDPGESVIRPSSRGPSYLTLTLKVYDGVYAHKDIAEGGKEHKDITSLLRIGKTLKIGEDTFEDLDEVMDRYVDPLVTHLKTMLSYRKFRKGTKAEVDEQLRIEKSEYPMRIVYCFGISHEHPGTFILTYIRSSNPHHEYIGLYPKGFKFRKRMFEDIDRLVSYFQRHIDDPVHDSAPSIRSVAAMVPMRSPATGGSSAASVGSAWGGSMNGGGWRGHSYDRDRSSTPGSRTGRNDYRNNNNRDGHPSGLPRPHGGRGRGRGSYNSNNRGNSSSNDRQDSGYDNSRWDSTSKDGNEGWNSFPGAKIQNSPGREAFPGSWGLSGNGAGESGWGSNAVGDWGGAAGGSNKGPDNGNSGWGGDIKKSSQIESGWSGNGSSGW